MDIEKTLTTWANNETNIEAVIRIGSRAQANSKADEWSDWDYQIICKSIEPYLHFDWTTVFPFPCWCINKCITPRGVPKISIIFENAQEVEFVLLKSWQIKLLYFLMPYSTLHAKLPKAIRNGIFNLHYFVKPGYAILKGGDAWEKRLLALKTNTSSLQPNSLSSHITQFWIDATWIYKQIRRGNLHAAMRLFHLSLREHIHFLLEMESHHPINETRFEGRNIEHWLSAQRLEKIKTMTAPDKNILTQALKTEILHFDELSNATTKKHHLPKPSYDALKKWLLDGCDKILSESRN